MRRSELGFAALAAVVLVGLLVGAVGADDSSTRESGLSLDVDVPDVHAPDPPTEPGVATVGGTQFDSVQDAVDAAEPGQTVTLEGRFEEEVHVNTSDITIASADGFAVVDGGGAEDVPDDGAADDPDAAVDAGAGAVPTTDDGATGETATQVDDHVEEDGDASGEGTVVEIESDNVTVEGVWIRNSGYSAAEQHAGVLVSGDGVTIADSRITDVTFGIWVHSAADGVIRNNTIVGHEDVDVLAHRGNGIHLFEATGTQIEDNWITGIRDGIYFSWASDVVAADNVFWDSRFGVHYMYSDDNRLDGNVAFDNDVGYALMVSRDLEIVENVAFNNRGPSGHGILILQIDDTVLRGNEVVNNDKGFHVDNSQRVTIEDNLALGNDVGIHVTSGTRDEAVTNNSFVDNDRQVYTPMSAQKYWNGNYWSDASTADLDGDGTSEIRHRPEGMVENVLYRNPQATIFAESPAFDAIRLAESSFPVIESPGVIDERPRLASGQEWRVYYEH